MSRLRTQILFEGLNINKTISALSKKFPLFDVWRQGKRCAITVKSDDSNQVVAYLEEKWYNIIEVKNVGMDFWKLFFKKHFLLPLFFAVAIVAFALLSCFCWQIDVSGDYNKEEVLTALSESNVKVGQGLFDFDSDSVENALAVRLDAMYVVVERRGSSIFVNAVGKKTVPNPIDLSKRRDIFATCSGTVTHILCEQGTCLVKVGDIVEKGDCLIVGQRTRNDGTCEDVYAMGKITVEVTQSAFAEFFGTSTETVETGRKFFADSVVLFGKSYGKLPPFEAYRTETTQTILAPLGITILHTTYYETVQKVKTVTLFECFEQLKAQALAAATQKCDFPVLGYSYRVVADGVWVKVWGQKEII